VTAPAERGPRDRGAPGGPAHSAPLPDPLLEERFRDAFLDIWLAFACSGEEPWPSGREARPRPRPEQDAPVDLAPRLRSLARALQRAVEEGRPGPLR